MTSPVAGRRAPDESRARRAGRLAQKLALGGFILYAVSVPHSIAGAWIGLSFAILGWLVRALATGKLNLRRTPLDLPFWLFIAWTIASSLLSVEMRVSTAKLASLSVFFIFYLTSSLLTRRSVCALAVLMILSAAVGVGASLTELARGRGVRISEIAADSPLRAIDLQPGDAVWRVNRRRVSSIQEIDEELRRMPAGQRAQWNIISHGEHAERFGPAITEEMKARPSPSGLMGEERARSFRASGWTSHYETFAEVLQMLAQLALGFALALFLRRRSIRWTALAASAFALLGVGIALTAMRTTLIAFAIGASIIAWRAARGRARIVLTLVIVSILALGAYMVARVRAEGALRLQDASTSLRWEVAQTALTRIPQHPFFGHGMDAVNRHWTEWGFPGTTQVHTHSTPLQIAFDRGLPALAFWLWLMAACWLMAARSEKPLRDSSDACAHGLTLGATGALAGFLASSLVNYNFGDAEVTLLFWWIMGAVRSQESEVRSQNRLNLI